MADIGAKVACVKSQKQTRDHCCRWPGCGKRVPPALWGCRDHWYRLPKAIRDRIWATYVPGQEKALSPTREYLVAAREAEEWIGENDPGLKTNH